MQENTDTGSPQSTSALLTLTAAGAGTFNSPLVRNPWGAGVNLGINVTVDAIGAVVFSLQGYDTASQQFYTILSSISITAPGFSILSAYPGLPATANVSANALLPTFWRVQAVVTTGPITATVGASVIV